MRWPWTEDVIPELSVQFRSDIISGKPVCCPDCGLLWPNALVIPPEPVPFIDEDGETDPGYIEGVHNRFLCDCGFFVVIT